MLRNLEKQNGKVEFQSAIGCRSYFNIIDELKAEGDWELLEKYSGFEFNDAAPKAKLITQYENMMYLERPGCNLCMGNQEKSGKRRHCFGNFYRLFQGRVVEDSDRKKRRISIGFYSVVVLSAILGRIQVLTSTKQLLKEST